MVLVVPGCQLACSPLPTVKQVAAEVTVNPDTVTKAYREGRQGAGTFVLRRTFGMI